PSPARLAWTRTSGWAPRPLRRRCCGRTLRRRVPDVRLTLSQVSRRSGVSTQFLSEVERGLKYPSSEVIEAVTIALGLEVPDVLVLTSNGMRRGFLRAGGRYETTARSALGRVERSLSA